MLEDVFRRAVEVRDFIQAAVRDGSSPAEALAQLVGNLSRETAGCCPTHLVERLLGDSLGMDFLNLTDGEAVNFAVGLYVGTFVGAVYFERHGRVVD